jgi:pilus assembly protein Flp/PilA
MQAAEVLMIKNQKGQSLIEYLLLVAVMGVAAIGVVRILSQTVQAKFAQVAESLNGRTPTAQAEAVTREHYTKRNMGDFFEGASN